MKDKNSQLVKQRDLVIDYMQDVASGQRRAPLKDIGLDKKYEGWLYANILKDLNSQIEATREAEGLKQVRSRAFELRDEGFPLGVAFLKATKEAQALTDTQGDCNCPMGSDQSQSKYTCPVHGDTQGDRKDTND